MKSSLGLLNPEGSPRQFDPNTMAVPKLKGHRDQLGKGQVIDSSGGVSLPLGGRFQIAGLILKQAGALVSDR